MIKRVLCVILCAVICPALVLLAHGRAPGDISSAYLDKQGNAYLVCHDKDNLMIWRYSFDGKLSGGWKTSRYDGYDYFQIDSLAFDGSRVFCNLRRTDSRDFSLRMQTWLELDLDSGGQTEIFSDTYGAGPVPFGSYIYFSDEVLKSVTYYSGGLLIYNITNQGSQFLQTEDMFYTATARFLSQDIILISDVLGQLRLIKEDGTSDIIRERGGAISALFTGDGGYIYYYDYDAGLWMKSAPETPDSFYISDLPSEITLEYIHDDRNFIAMEEDGPVYYRENSGPLLLKSPAPIIWKELFIALAVGVILGVLLILILSLVKKRRVSLIWRLMFIVVFVLALGAGILIYNLKELFESNHERDKITEALQGAAKLSERIDAYRLSNIDWDNPMESDYFDELYELFTYQAKTVQVRKLLPDQESVNESILENVYYTLLIPGDGTINIGVCDNRFVNVPVGPDSRLIREYLALYENPSMPFPVGGFEREDTDWLSVTVPVLSPDGTVAALIEAGFSKRQYVYETQLFVREILFQISAIIGLAALSLAVCLRLMLASVSRLRHAVEAAEKGDFSIAVPVRGRDEIAEISAAFNRMAVKIDNNTHNLQNLNDAYMRFLPKEVLSALGQESVLSIERGQYRYIETNILYIRIHHLDKATRSMKPKMIFDYVNQISQEVIETVLAHGGVVESYRQSEYVCLFENADEAMDSAVKISRDLWQLSPAPEITLSLVRGGALLGVTGHNKRLGTLMLSRVLKLSEKLGILGESCGSRILYTHDIELRHPYYRRAMGSVTFMEKTVSIFECFESDENSAYMSKREHTPLFEQGVELFEHGAWEESRAVFIRYIKESAPDAAAKYFLFLCEEKLSNGKN